MISGRKNSLVVFKNVQHLAEDVEKQEDKGVSNACRYEENEQGRCIGVGKQEEILMPM